MNPRNHSSIDNWTTQSEEYKRGFKDAMNGKYTMECGFVIMAPPAGKPIELKPDGVSDCRFFVAGDMLTAMVILGGQKGSVLYVPMLGPSEEDNRPL